MSPTEKAASDVRYKPEFILAFDGGPSALVYTRLLYQLEKHLRDLGGERGLPTSLLEQATMYTGTSAGAYVAAYLAYQKDKILDPVERLESCIQYTNALFTSISPGPKDLLRFLTGLFPLAPPQKLRHQLEQFFGYHKITDIDPNVVQLAVSTLQIKQPFQWCIFTNVTKDVYQQVPLEQETLVDLLMSSSAFPLMQPVHQGRLDGGMFANNSSMDAMALVINKRMGEELGKDKHTLPATAGLRDVKILSLGGQTLYFGNMLTQLQVSLARTHWGWIPWFISPFQPFQFMDTTVVGNVQSTNFDVGGLLGPQFLRLAHFGLRNSIFVQIIANAVRPFPRVVRSVQEQVDEWFDGQGAEHFSTSLLQVETWLRTHWNKGEEVS